MNGMQERLADDWLTKASERALEGPFCHLLTAKGYTVLHMCRHGELEQGKDIMGLDPGGRPCAFQLKAPQKASFKQRDWESIAAQVSRLVELPINYPGIPDSPPHTPILVVNSTVDDVVTAEIHTRNRRWRSEYGRELVLWERGFLLRQLLDAGAGIWPIEEDARDLLELYLADGGAFLPKPQFPALLERSLGMCDDTAAAEVRRQISGAGILAGLALSPFASKENHWAQIEGWTVFVANAAGTGLRHGLTASDLSAPVRIAEAQIEQLLFALVEELRSRTDGEGYLEGDWTFDGEFYRFRMRLLSGLCGLAALWPWARGDSDSEAVVSFALDFLRENSDDLGFWGEGCMPHFLAAHWALNSAGDQEQAASFLRPLLKILTDDEFRAECGGIPSPYVTPAEVVMQRSGFGEPLRVKEEDDRLHAESYYLESVLALCARRGWRDDIAQRWADVTRIEFCRFKPDQGWQMFTWHCPKGDFETQEPRHTQSWAHLTDWASTAHTSWLPGFLTEKPHLLLLFLMVYPHRVSPDLVKLLDQEFSDS